MRSFFVTCFVVAVLFAATPSLRSIEPGLLWSGFPALESGDVNSDGDLDVSDAVSLLSWLYMGGADPAPLACATGYAASSSGDLNRDSDIDLSDPIYLLAHLYKGGPEPANGCADSFGLGAPVVVGGGAAGTGTLRILPAHAHAFGKSLGEWTAAWWQWAIAMPTDAHPLFDTADCGAGQSGKVWFLGGAFTGTVTTRECAVPHGKAILVPVVNVDCSTVEPPPFFGSNEAELRACAKSFLDPAAGLSLSIDGQDVTELDSLRVQSPVFDFTGPDNNILFVPGPISGQAVSDGVWALLAPLSTGEHVLHLKASFPEFNFHIDVTYNLIVG